MSTYQFLLITSLAQDNRIYFIIGPGHRRGKGHSTVWTGHLTGREKAHGAFSSLGIAPPVDEVRDPVVAPGFYEAQPVLAPQIPEEGQAAAQEGGDH